MKRKLPNQNQTKRSFAKRLQLLGLIVLISFIGSNVAFAGAVGANANSKTVLQKIKIAGTVTSKDDKLGIPGVSVIEKGTTNGTITDLDGKYSLSVNPGAKLLFTFVGMQPVEMEVGENTTIDIVMTAETHNIQEVVVTALGIEKKSKGLTYSAQKVGGDELTGIKEVSMVNSLSGKIAGVDISRNGVGNGGSTRVVMRGSKSIRDNDRVLFVVDGMPLANNQQTPSSASNQGTFGGRDFGDGISNLNPDDIESITVLKGASAAALYGSQAANGCILITTKKGKAGLSKIEFSNNTTFDVPYSLPEFQTKYGQSSKGDVNSWGSATNNPTVSVKDWFQTGVTQVNSVALTSGTDKTSSYVSYANTSANGIMPTNDYSRHNFTIRQTAKLYDKMTVDASLNYINQSIHNMPSSGFYFNPLTGLYLFPRGGANGNSFESYQNNFETFSSARNMNLQNWHADQDIQQNPAWILNRNASNNTRSRWIGSLSLRYDILPGLFFQTRANMDRSDDIFEQQIYAGTQGTLAASSGRYINNTIANTQMYADAILNLNKNIGLFNVSGTAGTSITDSKQTGFQMDSYLSGLYYPNFFQADNMMPGSQKSPATLPHKQLQSAFMSAQVSYNDLVYLELTGRNDWSSALDKGNNSYFYPSAGLTFVLNELLSLPKNVVDLGKARVSLSQVGSDIPAYFTNPLNTLDNNGNVIKNPIKPVAGLKPEKTTSFEVGTEWRFFLDKLSLDFTYYKTNTVNQLISAVAPASSGYSNYYVNAGDIQNQGVEVSLGIKLFENKVERIKWQSTFNFAMNRNKVKSYTDFAQQDILVNDINGYQNVIKVGGSMSDMYAVKALRAADGAIYVDKDGKPQAGGFQYVGNPNPKANLSWNNQINYKDFFASVVLSARFGGTVLSMTEELLDGYGVSKRSGDARDAGGVDVKAYLVDSKGNPTTTPYGKKIDAQTYYSTIGGRGGMLGEYAYDATNIRVRELSLGYNIPKDYLKATKIVKSASLSFVAKNPIILMKNSPNDPEYGFSTSNLYQGLDIFPMPATKSFGFNFKVEF